MARSREPSAGPHYGAAIDPVGASDMGEQLKVMFGEMSAGPMPSRLLDLADRLEEAFQRGDLFACSKRTRLS